MTERPIIALVEDMEVRVEWLAEKFPDADIVWATTVDEFFAKLRVIDRSRLALILLDHDLGGPFFGSAGADGKTGLHAAQGLEGWYDVAVIIWSINEDGAKEMLHTLNDFRVNAVWIPFLRQNLSKLEAVIASQVRP